MPLVPGTRLGPYAIAGLIGAGGMGEVYRGRDERLGRDVAIKVVRTDVSADPERLARFEREARAMAALSHPHVLAVYDVGSHDGVPYLVEELLEGESLKARLERGPLPAAEATHIATDIAKGLAAAHERGIVHRDLKPANVFVTRDGTIKILDFGLAKVLPRAVDGQTVTLTAAPSATAVGAVVGTVAYMAPEQVRGQRVDQRADVFAFGVMLHEMLAGERPFRGATSTDLSAAILKDDPAPLPASAGPALGAVVARCLRKEPSERYQHGSELRAALEAVQSGTAVSPSRAVTARSARLWALAAAVALAALTGALVLDVAGLRSRLSGGASAPSAIRLAVLPFANLSGDPGQEYLADGFTQEMIAQLGRLHPQRLSVIARTSVMRYKKGDTAIDQVGRDLGVEWILEGSARREGNLVRVTAELIHVPSQAQAWADTYQREVSGLLAVQSDVAEKVAAALALELLPAEQTRLATAPTVDPDAYEAYLKGTYHWQRLTREDADTAQRYFERALGKDPSYAPAHEGLAWTWIVRQQMFAATPQEAGPNAKAAALRAISLDDTSAGAHEALAAVRMAVDWDWSGAEAEWKRAIELNPNSANAHAYFGQFLAMLGRPGDGIPYGKRSIELDPLNATYLGFHARLLCFAGRFDEAIAAGNRARAVAGRVAGPGAPAVECAMVAREMRDAHVALQRERIAGDPERLAAFERGLAAGGYQAGMRAVADLLAARYEQSGGAPNRNVAALLSQPPRVIATWYVFAGDYERSLAWLEKALEVRDPQLVYLAVDPVWEPVRDDPRFRNVLRAMRLPLN